MSEKTKSSQKIAYIAYTDVVSKKANVVNILNMCQALKAAGLDITLIVPKYQKRPDSETNIFHKFSLSQVFPIVYIPKLSHFLGRIDAGGDLFVLAAVALAKFRGVTVCYTRLPYCAYFAYLLGMQPILEMHMPPSTKLDALSLRAIARRQNDFKIIVISGHLGMILHEDWGLTRDTMLIAHDAVNIATFNVGHSEVEEVRTLLRLTPGTMLITYAGSLGNGRGVELIASLSKIFSDAVFLVLGGEERLVRQYRETYKDLKNLRFFGHVSHRDVPKFLGASDILLMPYDDLPNDQDGINTASYRSPMKLFEYLASGKPFVAPIFPSLTEVLDDGRNCLLAGASAEDDWAEKLRLLLNDRELRGRLSKGARQTALTHTWDARAAKVIDFAFRGC